MNNSANDLVSDTQDLLSLERQFCAARPVLQETVGCKMTAVCFLWVLRPVLETCTGNFPPSPNSS